MNLGTLRFITLVVCVWALFGSAIASDQGAPPIVTIPVILVAGVVLVRTAYVMRKEDDE